ncbi:hypothetical protein P167DRAFT_175250 [Morchella conica CCBAS932]|uniref:Increased loss of mitochondrial DNA protein 1 n=1 Tax=Morchella conica CCBAS932 TaxID=1392247 RepID=A0A3N4KRM8_9PEZI|nr:hypothetical protein P167DRAFT_175250 [Morchella conica CCBAS932]
MAIFSGYTLIRLLTAAHIFLGTLLILTPKRLTEQPIIFLLGEAVGLSQPTESFYDNPLASSVLGLMFILSGLSDLFAVSSMEEVSRGYWDAQSPVRMTFFACVTGYTYIFRPGRGNTAASHPLKNSLVFTWAFIEVLAWFWIYQQLREERRGAQERIEKRRRMHAKLMAGEVDDFGR